MVKGTGFESIELEGIEPKGSELKDTRSNGSGLDQRGGDEEADLSRQLSAQTTAIRG